MTTADRLGGLIGLDRAKRLALRLASGTSETHAVLFYGPEGAGKSALAQALAQAWLCTSPGPEGACGACASCLSAARGAHPDLLLIEPMPPSHIIRLAAITGGDDALSVQQLFRTPPLAGRNKVAIINSAERMNADAANAFLKTLEEPPPRAKLILTSASPGSMLATILSRCLACACQLPSTEEIMEGLGADDFTVQLGDGAPGRVQRLAQVAGSAASMREFAESVARLRPREALMVSERFKAVSEARDTATGVGTRRAQVESLAELGIALRAIGCHSALPALVEAHRRILGNGSATLVFDQLFTRIACSNQTGNSSQSDSRTP